MEATPGGAAPQAAPHRPPAAPAPAAGDRHLPVGPVPSRHRRLAHRRLRRPALVRPLRVAQQADLGRQLRHRSRLDVPGHLPAVLAARRAAGEVRQGAEQPRRLHPRQPHRRRQPPEVEGPAGHRGHLAGLTVLRRRARPGGRHRQHRQQDRRPLLRPLPHPRRQAAEARLRQRRLRLQRPAGEPRLRRRARHGGGGDQTAGALHLAGRPHRRRRRLRRSSCCCTRRASRTSCTCRRCRATASGTPSSWCRWPCSGSCWPSSPPCS